MANFLADLVDKASTFGRNNLGPVLGPVNPFNVDAGISELLNGGRNTANSGKAPVDARYINQNAGRLLNDVFNGQSPQNPAVKSADQLPAPTGQAPTAAPTTQSTLGSAPQQGASAAAAGPTHAVQYNGQVFDLDDPSQVLAYRQSIAQNLGAQRDQLLSQANSQYSIQSGDAANQLSRQLSQLEQQIQDNQKSAKDFVTSHLKTVNDFNQGKGQGDVQRAQNFASLSPNAFQSSQATSQQSANDQYLQGLGDLEKNAQDNVGLDYLNDPNDPTKLDANSTFGRQQSDLNQGKGDVNSSYSNYLRDLSSGVSNYTNQVNQNYTNGLDSSANSLGVGSFQGSNPFSYSAQQYSPVQANQVDLSKYTPYTNTQSLSQVPATQAGGFNPLTPSANPFANQSVTDSYLNRTNTTIDNGQSDFLKKYLLGK